MSEHTVCPECTGHSGQHSIGCSRQLPRTVTATLTYVSPEYASRLIARISDLEAERDQLRQQLAEKEQALVDLRDYFAYGQGEHKGMMAVTTPRCSPSVWKEINRRVDEALALAAPKE